MKLSVSIKIDAKILAAAAILAASLYGAYVSHETIYKATPDYSFSLVVEAAREGDDEAISRLTDTHELSVQLADALLRHEQNTSEAVQFLLLPAKSSLVQTIEEAIFQELCPQENTENQEKIQNILANAGKKAGLILPADGWQYQSSSWSTQNESGYATITAEFYNDALQASIPLSFKLERVAAHEWHIVGLTDTDATIQALQQAGEAAIASENKPIRQEIDQLVTVRSLSASVVSDPDKKMAYLRIQYTPVLSAKGKETLKEASGIYELRRQDSSLLFSMPVRLALYADGTAHTSQFRLLPSIPNQADLIDAPSLEGLQSSLVITSATLADGTRLQIKDSLETTSSI